MEGSLSFPRIFLSGNSNSRIFIVESGKSLSLDDFYLHMGVAPDGDDSNRGESGGAILIDGGTVRAFGCRFVQNSAGFATGFSSGGDGGAIAVTNSGSLYVEFSRFEGNQAGQGGNGGFGGAIYNSGGTVEIKMSLFEENSAGTAISSSGGAGGAIASFDGSLSVDSSTFAANHAGDAGFRGGSGGAVFVSGSFDINQCSFGGNRTGTGGPEAGDGGAINVSSGSGTINDSTIHENRVGSGSSQDGRGGGLAVIGGVATVDGTTISGSSIIMFDDPIPDCFVDFGTLNRSGVNLIGNNSGVESIFEAGAPNAGGDLVGTANDPIDPLLAPLADNGGPTETMLPYLGSPLIDPPGGATMSAETTDQRELPRIVNGVKDIGAVEVQDGEAVDPPPPPTDNTAAKRKLQKQIKKLTKQIKAAKKKGKKALVKKLTKKLKKLKKQLKAL